LGCVTLPIKTGDLITEIEALVTEDDIGVILGMDWLTQNDVHWRFGKDVVSIGGKQFPLIFKSNRDVTCRRCVVVNHKTGNRPIYEVSRRHPGAHDNFAAVHAVNMGKSGQYDGSMQASRLVSTCVKQSRSGISMIVGRRTDGERPVGNTTEFNFAQPAYRDVGAMRVAHWHQRLYAPGSPEPQRHSKLMGAGVGCVNM
jgi:hypothetical protein